MATAGFAAVANVMHNACGWISVQQSGGTQADDNPDLAFAKREQGMLDEIARERGLSADDRRELGRAVERYKREHGLRNSAKLPKRVIEQIASDEGF